MANVYLLCIWCIRLCVYLRTYDYLPTFPKPVSLQQWPV